MKKLGSTAMECRERPHCIGSFILQHPSKNKGILCRSPKLNGCKVVYIEWELHLFRGFVCVYYELRYMLSLHILNANLFASGMFVQIASI